MHSGGSGRQDIKGTCNVQTNIQLVNRNLQPQWQNFPYVTRVGPLPRLPVIVTHFRKLFGVIHCPNLKAPPAVLHIWFGLNGGGKRFEL